MAVSAAELAVGVLGPLRVEVEGVEATVPVGNQRRLLASLLLGRGRVVPGRRLVEDVWGMDPPEVPDASLHTTVARLRRSLGAAGGRLRTGPGGYLLGVAEDERDDGRFLSLVASAREARSEERMDRLESALALWRGEAWQEFRDDLAAGESRQLEEMRWQARTNLAEAAMEAGRLDDAVGWLRELMARRPLQERTIGLLVEALDRSGAIEEALAEYAGFRERLAEQMGLDPSPWLDALHARVLRRERSSEALTAPAEPRDPPPAYPGPGSQMVSSDGPLGREELLALVAGRAGPGTLVTLVGPGGVGKTTVAAAYAGRAGRVWWVDLVSAAPEDDLVELLLAETGGRSGAGTDSREVLGQRLASAGGLLVLDNCEHLVDHVAELVETLLAAAPELTVLATSRHRLGLAVERLVQVPPLRVEGGGDGDVAPAVALFLERVDEAGTDLGADPEARRLVTTICRRLDGLPLAIELAARQVGPVSLTDLAAHLAERVDLLAATGRAGHARHRRHQTLRETMRWSYELLDPVEQRVFRGLGVFAAEFELSAAQRVVCRPGLDSGQVAVAVAELVRRSMVVAPAPVGSGRYRLLETLRVFARELSDEEEKTGLERCHGEWVERLVSEAAEGLRGPAEPAWARRLQALLPEVRAVFGRALVGDLSLAEHIAVSLGRWGYLTLNSETLGLAERVLERQAEPSAPVLLFAASAAWLRGDFRQSRELARRALDAPGGSEAVWSLAYEALADSSIATGDPGAAVELCRTATALALRAGRPADAALTSAGLALGLAYAGEEASAEAVAALALAQRSQNPSALAFAYYARGEVLGDHEPEAALDAYARSRDVDVGPVSSLSHSVARTSAAALLGRVGPLEPDTFRHVADTVEHWTLQGQTGFLVTSLRNAVPLLVRAGEDATALRVGDALRLTPTQHASYGLEAETVNRSLGEAARRASADARSYGWLDLVDAARLTVTTLRRHTTGG